MKISQSLAVLSLSGAAFAFPAVSEHAKRDNARYVKDPVANTSSIAPYPTYRAVTDFDYESFNLALYQEWIELDLFHYGVAHFSEQEFADAGLGPDDISLLEFMANQETGHAQLVTNIMGAGNAPKQCTYNYTGAFNDVRSYIDFNQRLTRWGESGVLGFLTLLNSRDSAHLLQQSIHTEARQQMIFRQWSGSQPMPVFFEPGIPQAWAWTLLQPYIASCPPENPKVGWSVFPKLTIENGPTLQYAGSKGAVSTNRTALTAPSQEFHVTYEKPGKQTGPDNAYTTSIKTSEPAKFAMLVAQLNVTYVPLSEVTDNSATFYLPYQQYLYDTSISTGDPVLNGTGFVALTSKDLNVTPYNFSLINDYVVAGPAVIQFG